MQNATKYFFELLQLSIGRREALSGTPNLEDWKLMFRKAHEQALIGVFTDAVCSIPEEMRPSRKPLIKLRYESSIIADANRRLFAKCCDMTQMLASDGFSSCVLKGQGIALLYPNPLLRQSGDIDVWAKPLNTPESVSIEDYIYNYAQGKGKITDAVYHHVSIMIAKDNLEIHFRPSYMFSPVRNRRLQEWFKAQWPMMQQHSVTVDSSLFEGERAEGTRSFHCPTPEFNIIYILLHIYRHLFHEGIGLRQLLDYYYVIMAFNAQADETLRKETICTLHHLGIYNFAGAVMHVLHEVFALPQEEMPVAQDAKAGRFLLSEIMRSGNFGKHDDRVKIKANEKPLHKLIRRWIHSLRLLRYFPGEVLWLPYFKFWQRCWRLRHGWIKSMRED